MHAAGHHRPGTAPCGQDKDCSLELPEDNVGFAPRRQATQATTLPAGSRKHWLGGRRDQAGSIHPAGFSIHPCIKKIKTDVSWVVLQLYKSTKSTELTTALIVFPI